MLHYMYTLQCNDHGEFSLVFSTLVIFHVFSKLIPFTCSQTSRKPTKMSGLSGGLREVVAYESLDYIGSKFCRDLPAFYMFYSYGQFRETRALLIEKFRSLVPSKNVIVLQHFIIQFPL